MRIVVIVFIFFIFSCNDKEEKSNQLQDLQKIFGTANWQVVNGNDTSYIFFSPQVDNSFKTYQYNLFKGDSANTEMGSIKENDGKVEWDFFDKTLVLDDIRENEIAWRDSIKGVYFQTRKNDSLMQMKTPDRSLQFKKTLPLSTFLVRAKYDYEQGSKLSGSSEIKPRKGLHY